MNKQREFYKYIHLIYAHDEKFVMHLLKTFNDKDAGFKIDDHLFVVCVSELYEVLKVFPNVILDNSKKNLYLKYAKHCSWIISHGMETQVNTILTPRHIRKKIIYRYWGGSRTTGLRPDIKHPISFIRQNIKIFIFKRIMESFAAIGVANNVDIADLSRKLSCRTRYYFLGYPSREKSMALKKAIMENKNRVIENQKIKVLLGHRGKPEGNHIKNLERLKKYDSNLFDIYIPLSYGDEEYIDKVKKYVYENNITNVIIIEDFIPFDKYVGFLAEMDICLFDGETSYALGNISMLLALEKTIYLSKDGILKIAFDLETIPYRLIEDIGNLSFKEFSFKFIYNSDNYSLATKGDYQQSVNRWKKLFEDFS